MSNGRYASFDEYGFRHFAADLCDLGLWSELYGHTTSREWFEAQTLFDPSRRTYADSLDWAVRAAETDPEGLPALLTLTVLRPTVDVLAGQVPTPALEVMARLGEGERAEAYAGLRRDPSSRCEALCRIAAGRSQSGDSMGARKTLLRAKRDAERIPQPAARVEMLCDIARALSRCGYGQEARESLSQAERETLSISSPPARTQSVARVGLVAQEVGAPDIRERAAQEVRTVFEQEKSPAAVLARKLDLLDRPDYLMLMAERQSREDRLGLRDSDPVAVVAGEAAAREDDALLDALLALTRSEASGLRLAQVEALAGALTEAGRVDEAFALIEASDLEPDMEIDLRGTVAQAAGRHGDLATIERAACVRPAWGRRPAISDSLDWKERLERTAASAGHGAKRVGWRLAGIGNWERLQVLLDGADGLAQEYPEQARAVWERAKAEGGWLWRRMAPLFEGLYPQVLGFSATGPADGPEERDSAQPSRIMGILLRVVALGARWDAEGAEVLASFGRFDQALEAVQKIEQPQRRANALADLASSALDMGDIARAMAAVEAIEIPETRKQQLDRVAEALAERPHDETMALLSPFAAQADRLDKQDSLVRAAALPALVRETARLSSVSGALDLVDRLGPDAVLAVLAALGEVAMAQGDVESARGLLARAEEGEDGSDWARVLAQLSAGWAGAVAAGYDAALAAPWTGLAARAFRLAWSRTDRLKPKTERRWLWPLLAQAARCLKDTKALSILHKRAKTLSSTKQLVDQALADQVLVHVLIGLIPPDPYLLEGKELWEIHHREYRAQVLAEMADNLSRAPSQKDRRRAGEAWEFKVGLLLDHVKMHLTVPGGMALLRLGIRSTEFDRGQPPETATRGPLGRWASSQPSIDEESVLARLHERSRLGSPALFPALQPSPEQNARLESSGRAAIERAFAALARAGRYDDVVDLAQQTPPPSDRAALAAAVRALAQAGQLAPARRLLSDLKAGQDAYWALAGLADGLVSHDDPTARTLLEDLLSHSAALPDGALAIAAEATLRLPPEAQWRILCRGLRSGRERGRARSLAVVAALAPVAATLMGGLQWRMTVEKIVATETWFGPGQG